MGRNTDYTPELADKICELIAEDNTYEQIAAIDGMPCRATIIRWLGSHEEFATKCARAREIQADSIDNRIGSVIDKTENGVLPPDVSRVVLSGLQWRAEKKSPKKYGNNKSVAVSVIDAPKENKDAAVAAALQSES